MTTRLAPFAAFLLVLGFLTWMSSRERNASTLNGSGLEERLTPDGDVSSLQEPEVGSAVPCAVPLTWRIARVDDGFGLSTAEARAALQKAANLWEEALGRRLFPNDPIGGFPIRFVYDDRQARTQERGGLQELDEAAERLKARRAELDGMRERHHRMRSDHEHRLRDYRQRLAKHNATVRGWNESGDAGEEVLAELRASGTELESERRELNSLRAELEDLERRSRVDRDRFEQAVAEHKRRGRELEEAFPRVSVESGRYREVLQTRSGRIVSVTREIRIYRYDGLKELPLVVAHELGHALGLGHVAAPDALMSAQFDLASRSGDALGIRPMDLEALRSRCPHL